MASPYSRLKKENWSKKTEELVNQHPLDQKQIVDVVLKAWEGIMKTKIADELLIGRDIFPSPQIMGDYLHELIPIFLAKENPELWRKDSEKKDKDIVYIPNHEYSIEIKTSSNANNVYANRSYGQANSSNNSGKSKDGYYITINFDKFKKDDPNFKPQVRKIRFGWIDHSDWNAQKAATGQQSTISPAARDYKLLLIYQNKINE